MYHRVGELKDTPAIDSRSVSATPSGFAQQMRHLARYYHVVSMPDVLDAVKRNRTLRDRSVLITFDDAYADFADIAWPILKRFHLPATLFVPTAYPGQPELAFWWDRLYQAFAQTRRAELRDTPLGNFSLADPNSRSRSLRTLQNYVPTVPHDDAMRLVDCVCAQLAEAPAKGGSVLNWDQLRLLARDGVTLGSHTRTHPILTQLPPNRMREEIQGSQRDLKAEIGSALPIFCYPNGDHNETVTAMLREEGVELGFTTLVGQNELASSDLLRLKRTGITPRSSLPVFSLRVSRPGIYLDAWRHQRMKRPPEQGFPANESLLSNEGSPSSATHREL
jgi:peptidoglycan/xylan/chitin deacetylase (PgdA/CDA1 family)